MDACRRKREAKKIWKWEKKQKHINRYEITDKKGVIKRESLDTIPDNIKTSVITQMKETAKASQMSNYNIMVGEEVENRSGIREKVCRKKNKNLKIKTKIGKMEQKNKLQTNRAK
jgi:multidrug resistance efflux pump